MHTGTGLASAWDARLEDRKLRQLALAVLASLVLHALILSLLSGFKEFARSRATPPPLTARLAQPKPPPEPLKADVPPPRPPVARPAAKPPSPPPPRPDNAPASPAPVPAPVLSIDPAKQSGAPVLVVPAVPAAPAAPVPAAAAKGEPAPAAAAAPAASGPDPASVARFRLELMDVARRYKRYPRIAQDNNWEGRVELRIAFAESGAISSISVKKGAGRAVLDEQAQSMIRSAQPQLTIPPALRGKAFVLEVPVEFFLKEEN